MYNEDTKIKRESDKGRNGERKKEEEEDEEGEEHGQRCQTEKKIERKRRRCSS